jgi:hypothetical protein
MKPLKVLSIMLLLLLVASSLPAVAGVVNMQFNGTGSYSYGYPTYPYYFTVNGTPDSLMCIGYNEHITGGETWQANVMSVTDFGTLIGDPTKAEEVAYLFTLARADGGANSAINAEAWYLMEGVPTPEPDPSALIGFAPGSYPTVQVYVPIDGTQSWAGELPQTFLGSTPEPSTLLMMGSGLIGLAGLARKRLFS